MLIDDMEDGDDLICESGGRDGGWYTYAFENQPVQFERDPIPGGRGDSRIAAHLTASGLTGYGAGMGIGLKAYGRQLYDVAAVDGVTFWMKGDAPVIVQLRLAETTPTTNPPGTCTNPRDCDNHFLFRFPAPGDEWTEYRVPFTALRQRPGGSVAWNPAQVLALEFLVTAWDIDVWIDDIRFYTCEGTACVPTCANPALPVACPASGGRIAFCGPAGTDCANPPTLSYHTNVWGSGRDDVWIVGMSEIDDASTISHWDGYGLSTVTVSSLGLFGVWGSGPDDVWTFGMGGTIRRRQGGAWPEWPSSTTLDLFQGAWGSAANDIWTAGAQETIIRWDGATWSSPAASNTTVDLWGVWGSGPNDVWAVGAGGTIRRWNGSVWETKPSGTTKHLDCVWASGPNDAWAVGETVLRWNGVEWTPVEGVTNKFLDSVWGTGPDDVWAVGAEGTILHWDGSEPWEPRISGTTAYLNGIWGSSPDDVWVVGEFGTILHFDGSGWAPPP